MSEDEKWGSGPLSSQTLVIVNAPCESTVRVGQPVYFDPVKKIMKTARANSDSTSNVVGIVSVKSGRVNCNVVFSGLVTLDPATPFTPGSDYFLDASSAGALTTSPPTGSGHTVLKLATALTKELLMVRITQRLRRA